MEGLERMAGIHSERGPVKQGENQHVYPANQEWAHLFGASCPCVPEIIRQRPEDGLVFVHRRLHA